MDRGAGAEDRTGPAEKRRLFLIALPPRQNMIPEVSVTVTSQRPGVAGQVTIASNFNTPDGSYQVIRQRSARASSRIRAYKSISASFYCPPAFPYSESAPWQTMQTESTAVR